MSGFDLPPITGFDIGIPRNPFAGAQSPEGRQGPEGPLPAVGLPDRLIDTTGATGATGGARPFAGVLADSLDEVKGLQDDVKDKVRGLVLGDEVELHDVMIASSKSQVAFNLLLEVRNKMVDAWEKLSRSSV